ncbi:heme-binding protein [Agromyces seonyuensis]|uniref:Heme-degrading domain-containing protein n=1 Tax=Agromyces seonyuensis TaxID=2662446 RepID=A0A6I4P2Z6_9MICO|nr:heme-binding protein [Agromyces seonyuensis]MWB98509.1 hypothetical protein [Agromyces seonyuensis]
MDVNTEIARLEDEARGLELPAFTHEDAWRLGSRIRELALEAGLGVAIDIRRASGAILFRTALPGATADQEKWVRGKSAVVFRFEAASALVAARMLAMGFPEGSNAWLDPAEYALAGGGVPIVVAGAGIVAAATVSGATSEQDHRLVVDGIRALQSS